MLDSKLIPRALFNFENGGGSHFENRRGECPGYEVVLDSSCKYTLVISVKPIPISHTYHLMPKLQTLRLIQRSSKTISFGPHTPIYNKVWTLGLSLGIGHLMVSLLCHSQSDLYVSGIDYAYLVILSGKINCIDRENGHFA